ncbi:protein GPR15LG [Saccopteryx leptura]|uniref:protein GPR15LG n=1 Tax=Saccopteryx leptura TaxID=249018 RepID=UPI00339C75F1
MRFLVLSSLLCILLLCFTIFSTEGKRRPRQPAKAWKGKPCCPQIPNPVLGTRKGHRRRNCKSCTVKRLSWVVPGALPQV